MTESNDDLRLLAALEVAAMHRLVELEAARQRRLDARVADRTDGVFVWCEDEAEEDAEETLAALTAFLPVKWWGDYDGG